MRFLEVPYCRLSRVIQFMGKSVHRRCARAAICCFFVLLPLAVTSARDEPFTVVADLRYGVSLYHYYLNENLQALSELMVAQQRGGIQGHGDNPEIMEGGFSMAYGLERKASEIFTRLLDENRPQKTRDAAWYSLAQMRYLRGDWERAAEAVAKISNEPHPDLLSPIRLLRFNLAVRQNDLPQAGDLLHQTQKTDDAWPYMQFNYGSALSRQGDYAAAVEAFDRLLKLPQRSEEYLALYDKAMTASGYALLLQDRLDPAIAQFQRVRLDSPMSNRALLGYGWAALEKGDYQSALSPWQALSQRSLIDENTQEALVAIPYAYEKMGYPDAALKAFRRAESNYLAEIDRLDEVMKNVQGHAIREALNIQRSEDFDWLNYAEKSQLSPQLSYLIPLFSEEAFIGTVQELRDLLAIKQQYANWQSKLAFYRGMLDEREQNRVAELNYLTQQKMDEKRQAMVRKRDELASTLARIGRENDIAALVSPPDQPKFQRILRAEKNVQRLREAAQRWSVEVMPAGELEELAETLRRQKGLLLWHTAERFDERYWRVKRGLAEVNVQLQAMNAAQIRIYDIVDKGFDLDPYRQRISRAQDQLLSQSVDVERAIELAQSELRGQVVVVLRQQRARLQHYLAQSRLSISRLLDQSAQSSIETNVGQEQASSEELQP